ncbi:MAG: FecR family protein [Bdellovibrionia bacterium]
MLNERRMKKLSGRRTHRWLQGGFRERGGQGGQVVMMSLAFFLASTQAFSDLPSVGRVVLAKGQVKQILGSEQRPLKEGDLIQEGGMIQTGPASSIKLLLQDQSSLSLGPESSLSLDEIRNRGVPNISLVQGQLRSKVMKNILLKSSTAPSIKFIVRTKSAAMGVRGTDFQVVYNPQNNVTSLVTFEGAVAMVKQDPSEGMSPPQTANLVPLLASERAVVVTEGRFSSANPVLPQATLPVKISPAQFESLKRTDPAAAASKPEGSSSASTSGGGSNSSSGAAGSGGKSVGSPIPPGVDPKAFSSNASASTEQVASALGISAEVQKQGSSQAQDSSSSSATGTAGGQPARSGGSSSVNSVNGFVGPPPPPPEGQYNAKSGAYAPPAGGFLDLATGLYIAPPPGSVFDANAGVYVPPSTVGNFDAKTGSYVPPKDFQLDPKQGLMPSAPPVATAQGAVPPSTSGASAPSSAGGGVKTPAQTPSLGGTVVGQSAPSASGSAGSTLGLPLSSVGVAVLGVGAPPFSSVMPGGSVLGATFAPPQVTPYGGYQQPIVVNLPPPPPPPPAYIPLPAFAPTANGDPACPLCAPPPPPPASGIPPSTNVRFSFSVE